MDYDANSYERYSRQLLLKEFGPMGQEKLAHAKLLVVGAGGLGCPALQYLTAAGVGKIGIVDYDTVALHNLHRQVLYHSGDIGLSKVECAAKALHDLNPEIEIITYYERLSPGNAVEILRGYDIVIDGSDNFSTRYMINDACVLMGIPLVYGAVSKFEGQVAVFNVERENEPKVNYRDLFPTPPLSGEVSNCAEDGVLGVLPGIIGTMMANEAIKLITGIGQVLVNRLYTFNALNNRSLELKMSAANETRSLIPADLDSFQKTDYEWLCSGHNVKKEICIDEFNMLINQDHVAIIDVREPSELPLVNEFICSNIPLGELLDHASQINQDIIVTFCQTGRRSNRATEILSEVFGMTKKIYSLRGGIQLWKQQATKQPV